MWRQTTTQDAAGGHEAFSIGIDGFIWSYLVDAQAVKDGRLKSTGLKANSFALARTVDGATLLIGTDGLSMHYVLETDDGGNRWSAPCAMHFPGEIDVLAIEQIFVQSIRGNLFLGVQSRHLDEQGNDVYRFWDAVWAGGGFVFCNKPVLLEHRFTIWRQHVSSRPMSL